MTQQEKEMYISALAHGDCTYTAPGMPVLSRAEAARQALEAAGYTVATRPHLDYPGSMVFIDGRQVA